MDLMNERAQCFIMSSEKHLAIQLSYQPMGFDAPGADPNWIPRRDESTVEMFRALRSRGTSATGSTR
jgi:hypothetical protein